MRLEIHLIAAAPGASETTAFVAGEILTVDGTAYDLSAVPEGGQAVAQGAHPFTGPITRENGVIHAALVWRYDSRTARPDQGDEPVVIEVADGPAGDPVRRRKETRA